MGDVVSKRAKFGVGKPGNESEATNFRDQGQVKESLIEKDNGRQVDGGNQQEQSQSDAWREAKVFLKLQPLEFDGNGDIVQAERWVLAMEDIFKLMQCSESRKVLYATLRLTMTAHDWWMSTKRLKLPDDEHMITWASFKELFDMTVFQYLTKYNQLERYCALKHDEKVRADRFVQGLNRRLTEMIVSNYETLYDALRIASGLEDCLKRMRDDKQQTRAPSWRGNGQDNCM